MIIRNQFIEYTLAHTERVAEQKWSANANQVNKIQFAAHQPGGEFRKGNERESGR